MPSKSLDPRQPKSKLPETYLYEKVFTDGQFLAGGVLRLPVGGNKAIRPSKDNTYVSFLVFNHPTSTAADYCDARSVL